MIKGDAVVEGKKVDMSIKKKYCYACANIAKCRGNLIASWYLHVNSVSAARKTPKKWMHYSCMTLYPDYRVRKCLI